MMTAPTTATRMTAVSGPQGRERTAGAPCLTRTWRPRPPGHLPEPLRHSPKPGSRPGAASFGSGWLLAIAQELGGRRVLAGSGAGSGAEAGATWPWVRARHTRLLGRNCGWGSASPLTRLASCDTASRTPAWTLQNPRVFQSSRQLRASPYSFSCCCFVNEWAPQGP